MMNATEILSNPAVHEQLVIKMEKYRSAPGKECYGSFDSSSSECGHCAFKIRCAVVQGNPRLQVNVVQCQIKIRIGEGKA